MIAACKPMTMTRAGSFRPATISTKARRSMVVRSSAEETKPVEAPVDATVFYGGSTFSSEEEFKQAVAEGKVAQFAPASPMPTSADQAMSIGDLMAFSGPAPELVNGRLAMLAVVAAIGAELSSGETVLRQLADEPTAIMLTFITFTVASLIPLLSSTKREAFAFFTPEAEMLNGRAAMLGLASLLVIEGIRGSALF